MNRESGVDEQISQDFTCACNIKYCHICKATAHPGISCLKNSYQLEKGFGGAFLTCYCGDYMFFRQNSYFISCNMHNSKDYSCLVCNEPYNSHNHDSCIILFSNALELLI